MRKLRQFNEFRNMVNKQKEYFTKEIRTQKEHQTEILKLKNSLSEVNALESIGQNCHCLWKT